ncbi:UNVERIFIED_CONTAM: hypothetical protein Slati_1101900 [Sesamum latifolium]|uniref:Uncharacterized protein n=1 Tax=Sesamum latifolium TaxID=2727402 RepID=A0AAW2XBT3_9LAMI
MANSDNGGDNGSYEGNSSLPAAAGPTVLPADPAAVATNIPTPALDQIDGPAVLNPLFCEQLREFIVETINLILYGSQASGVGPSSQLERGGTPASQGMDEQVPTGLQQDQSTPADFPCKEAAGRQPHDIWQSLKK